MFKKIRLIVTVQLLELLRRGRRAGLNLPYDETLLNAELLRLIAIFSIVILAGILFANIRSSYMVPVVTCHSVTPEAEAGGHMQLSVNSFTRQMRFLKHYYYNSQS